MPNQRFFGIRGHGFGRVICQDEEKFLETLRSITVEQFDAIFQMILYGDIDEVALDPLLIGEWTEALRTYLTEFKIESPVTAEFIAQLQVIASLVYLSGHLAEDFEILTKSEIDFTNTTTGETEHEV